MTHSSFVGKRTAPSPNRFALSSRYWTKPRSSSSGLGHLCRCVTARDAWPRPRGSGSSAMTSTPCAASERATARPVMWQLKTSARGPWGLGGVAPQWLDAVKGAVDIRKDVVRVLDAHGDAQEAVGDAEALALFRGEAPVGRDGRIEHFGEEVADRRRGRRELESVEETEGSGLGVVAKDERHDASVQSAELARRDLVLRVVLETRIANARDLRVLREVPRHDERALALAPHAESERAHSSDREPGLVRRQVRAIQDGAVAHRTAQLCRAADRAAHDVAVAVHVLG